MAGRYRPRITRHNYSAIVEQEFREIERERRLRYSHRPDLVEGMDPVVYTTEKPELSETEAFLHALKFEEEDVRHPDTIGVSRRPEPKSITSNLPASRIGSFDKPKAGAGKILEPNPYTYTRNRGGRWRQRA